MAATQRYISITRAYLAGSYDDRERLRGVAADLMSNGIAVTSSWLSDFHEGQKPRSAAEHNLHEINVCDLFILDCMGSPSTRGGRWVEFGYAYHAGKDCVIICPRENLDSLNVFASLIRHYEDYNAFLLGMGIPL